MNFTWNERNQLVEAYGIPAGTSTIVDETFQYDAVGRRKSRTVRIGTGAPETTTYLYDGLNVVKEVRGADTINYLTGLGLDEIFTRIHPSATRYFLADALGSTIALTNPNGAVKSQFKYEPFGRTTVSGDTTTNRYRWTGREDEEMDLYYLRGRYYSQELHRFVSRDPIGFAGGDANLYSYVGNSPTNFTDPLGLYEFGAGLSAFGDFSTGDIVSMGGALGALAMMGGGGSSDGAGGASGGSLYAITGALLAALRGGEYGPRGAGIEFVGISSVVGFSAGIGIGGAVVGPISGLQLVQAQRTPTPFHSSPFPGLTNEAYSTWRGAGYSKEEIEALLNTAGPDYMNDAAKVRWPSTPGATPSPSGPAPTPGPASPDAFRG